MSILFAYESMRLLRGGSLGQCDADDNGKFARAVFNYFI